MNRSRLTASIASVVLAGAALTACAGGTPQGAPVEDVAGLWGMQDTEGIASLDLAEDGTATGTDGCNRMVGTWEQNGTQVAFGQWTTTRMACQSVDTWLSLSVKATLEGDNLIFADENGLEIGTLQPNS
ncbi:META domain-containing protein [Cellulomonas xylanilytica]|uniref:META domain-containing protein n=1 Tax=Cellulomonas xylanilytica TaxID=233583 RepID=A0A510UYF7_9CELL|nr:META domain-containing protein [Cellulomonas xylanilytica]GEK19698.1 META domain-containing protein [Cellulomonas xylanilytica]